MMAESLRGNFQTVEAMSQAFIREAILRGIYKPGERLNQDAIAAALGISRMPVRASLRQLEAEGLVHIYPHRGAMVAALHGEQIAEIYEMRVVLECYLLERAMANLDADVLAELEQLAEQLDVESDDLRLEVRKGFYATLYALADRPRALEEVKQLRDSVGRYLLFIRVDHREHHQVLLSHLRAGDVAKATEWLRNHLEKVSRELQRIIPEDGTAPR